MVPGNTSKWFRCVWTSCVTAWAELYARRTGKRKGRNVDWCI
jgi:hypothetical protein